MLKQSKACYTIESKDFECKKPESKHLPTAVVKTCFDSIHRPINPHSQRLLAAEAREANKPAAKQAPKTKAKPKTKSKAKGKEDENPVPRTKYAEIKKKFMEQEWLLDLLYHGK